MLPENRVIARASRSSALAFASSSSRRRRSEAILRFRELLSESSVIAARQKRAAGERRSYGRFPRVAPSGSSPYVAPAAAHWPISGTCAPVAQLDRAPDYESGGQR